MKNSSKFEKTHLHDFGDFYVLKYFSPKFEKFRKISRNFEKIYVGDCFFFKKGTRDVGDNIQYKYNSYTTYFQIFHFFHVFKTHFDFHFQGNFG